jgi:hypothetical protein
MPLQHQDEVEDAHGNAVHALAELDTTHRKVTLTWKFCQRNTDCGTAEV